MIVINTSVLVITISKGITTLVYNLTISYMNSLVPEVLIVNPFAKSCLKRKYHGKNNIL